MRKDWFVVGLRKRLPEHEVHMVYSELHVAGVNIEDWNPLDAKWWAVEHISEATDNDLLDALARYVRAYLVKQERP